MVTLVILDGFGERRSRLGNAIKCQGTPHLDEVKKHYPHTLLEASGEAVGLPEGIVGNSEVGHLTLGAGRTILQDLALINSEIENGKFFENPALIKAMLHAEKNKSSLHLMGILSDGRLHSHINHLFAILKFAKNFDIPQIYIHAFTDGRDTGPRDAKKYFEQLQAAISGTNAKIGTMMGRVYLDREERYDRVQKMYDLLVFGKGEKFSSWQEVLKSNYAAGLNDELLEPAVLDENATVKDNDSLLFFNYRSDREREISFAFACDDFKEFKTKKLKNFLYTIMTQYSSRLKHVNTLYPPKAIEDNLSAIVSQHGKTQFHTAETTKYAHVTFFFNGGIEKPYEGEDRKLFDSINVKDFSDYPKMRAVEISKEVQRAIKSGKYDFILVNFSNPDMLGHTGNFEATEEAIKCVEKEAYDVAALTLKMGGECIITADHGNAEIMFDKAGNVCRTHTCSPVPAILVSERYKNVKLKKNKTISSIAPTVLKLMGIEIPKNYDEPLF